ncbi:LETM1 domain-containing protein 1 [Gadus chalcogrammus]|uniref:LETM1 domain-containing protein 1 n=1 Tax=Gadus chalcogrammus TaxID=1042646 RepID=UPI0024C374BD|nr:LETM1 domain-containing protein 1 [Gadus chalcogrammus]
MKKTHSPPTKMALSGGSLCCRLSLQRIGLFQHNWKSTGHYFPNTYLQSRLSPCRQYKASDSSQGIGRHVSSRLQVANVKYENFLKRKFPRFYKLYRTFTEGFKLLFQDGKEVSRIQTRLVTGKVTWEDLPYREMERLRQFRRDLIKAIPLVVISIPPFANYLVFVLMYYFPRQLLVRHFWTPQQQLEFRGFYHSQRAGHTGAVLQGIQDTGYQVKDSRLQSRLQDLCTQVQNGAHPKVADIHGVRALFSGPPLGMKRMNVEHMRHICPLLFLTPRLPGFLIGRRLNSHALELLLLDRALRRLGPHQLSDSELKQACYVRGLNSDDLDANQCREWLSQWLQVTAPLKGNEGSLLLHSMVLLSANYPRRFSGQ